MALCTAAMAHPVVPVAARGRVHRELSSPRAIWWFMLASWLVYGIHCLSRYPQFLTAGHPIIATLAPLAGRQPLGFT